MVVYGACDVLSCCIIALKQQTREREEKTDRIKSRQANTIVSHATVNLATLSDPDQVICRRLEANIASSKKGSSGSSINNSITNNKHLDTVNMSTVQPSAASPGIVHVLPMLSHLKYEHFIAGISGGVVSTLTLHPLDLLKTRFAGKLFMSWLTTLRLLHANGGYVFDLLDDTRGLRELHIMLRY